MRREQGGLNRITRMLTSFDMFGEPVSFKVRGADTFPSLLGTIMSMVGIAILIAYAMDKYTIMNSYGDALHTSYQETLTTSNDFDTS